MERYSNNRKIDEMLSKALLDEFNLNVDANNIKLFNNNRNVYLIHAGDTVHLLKKHRFLSDDRVRELENILILCSDQKITPHIYPTKRGRVFIKYCDEYYSLMEYVKSIASYNSFFPESVAQVAARMHKVMLEEGNNNFVSPLRIDYFELERILRKNHCEHLLQYVDKEISLLVSVRQQSVHNDLHPGNILQSPSGNIYVIDFDGFSKNPLITDVAFVAFRLSNGDRGKYEHFINLYDKFNCITIDEKRYINVFLSADFIRKIGFILYEKEKGNSLYLKDLSNYEWYLNRVLEWI